MGQTFVGPVELPIVDTDDEATADHDSHDYMDDEISAEEAEEGQREADRLVDESNDEVDLSRDGEALSLHSLSGRLARDLTGGN